MNAAQAPDARAATVRAATAEMFEEMRVALGDIKHSLPLNAPQRKDIGIVIACVSKLEASVNIGLTASERDASEREESHGANG